MARSVACGLASVSALALLFALSADGHMFQMEPVCRQFYRTPIFQPWDYDKMERCPSCYNGQGPDEIKKRAIAETDPAILAAYGGGDHWLLIISYNNGENAPNAHRGSAELTRAVLSRGLIDINQGDPHGLTPLMVGSAQGASHVVKILLDNAADTSIAADDEFCALHISSQTGQLSVTVLLVKAGVDLEAKLVNGHTPLHLATEGGHLAVMGALIDAGANLNTRLPTNGETPLYTAACRGNVGAVRVLLRGNANALLTKTVGGISLVSLDIAARFGYVEVVRELLKQRGLEGCGGAHAGVTALYVNFAKCSSKVLRLLVDAGVDTTSAHQAFAMPGVAAPNHTLLAFTNRGLNEKKVFEADATEEQLNGLEGIRRLLLRLEAVHALSWLWDTNRAFATRAAGGTRKSKTISTPLGTMLPVLRRRAARPRLLLRQAFRYSVKP